MMFRLGGCFAYQGETYTTRVVHSREEQDAAADFFETIDGALSTHDAKPDPIPADEAPLTKPEVKRRLEELGIPFDGRLGLDALVALLPEAP